MYALHIDQFEARYRLPRHALSVSERLDGLLWAVLDEALELALEQAGVSPRVEICLREVRVPVRLQLSAPDRALIARWSEELASHIRQAIEDGGAGTVVRYTSRLNGWVDFAIGVARKNYARAWAWDQLGFAELAENPTDAEAATQFVAAMVKEGDAVVPVLSAVAKADTLHLLARRLSGAQWQRLAAAALAAAGGDPAVMLDLEPTEGALASTVSAPDTAQVLALSAMARAVVRYRRDFTGSGDAQSALTVLIGLEAEPTLLRRADQATRRRICAMRIELMSRTDAAQRSSIPVAPNWRKSPLEQGWNTTDMGQEHYRPGAAVDTGQADAYYEDARHSGQAHGEQDDQITATTPVSAVAPVGIDHEKAVADLQQPQRLNQPEPDERLAPSTDEERPFLGDAPVDYPLPETGHQVQTEYGGLLFLLSLVDELGLADALSDDARFKHRALRWILHRLAIRLTACAPTDPAALAFCGLTPETEPPWRDQPPPDVEERQALDETAERIVIVLRERLHWEGRDGYRLLHYVCQRRARLEADPGWLDVVLPLEAVSTDIRRAALDLDPGYLPWLGVVVKFHYE